MSHSRVVATWVPLVGASVTEALAAAVGHRIHTRRLEAPAGVVVALLIPMLVGVERRLHGAPRKLLIRTRKGAGHHSHRVLKPRIRMHRKVGEHQVGAHLLGHRIPTLRLRLRARPVAPDQDGEGQHPLGAGLRQNHPLGMRVRLRRPIMAGPVQDHRLRGVGASRTG